MPGFSSSVSGERRDDDGGDDIADAAAEARAQRLRSVTEWTVVLLSALLVALLLKAFLVQAYFIPSPSMEPTLEKGDRILVNKLSYDLHAVNRGDLVVFARPEAAQASPGDADDLIKRVIGIEGDVLQAVDGQVLVNGRVIEEDYLPEGTTTDAVTYLGEPFEVPEDHVFVMGDNRSRSLDARFFGAIPEESIVGRAFVRVWPLSDIGFF